MSRTKVFYYKGFIGIDSSPTAEGLLNNPLENGQLGYVVNADFVDISPDALEALKLVEKSGDDIGDVDAYQPSRNLRVFSWLGGSKRLIIPGSHTGSSTYDPEILEATGGVEVPQDFIDAVEGMLGK
jgi:hypothetical protein